MHGLSQIKSIESEVFEKAALNLMYFEVRGTQYDGIGRSMKT